MINASLRVNAMAPMARPVMMPPPTIHGVRLPKRERVMSDSVPKMMFASNATIAPIELTKPSMASLLELSISSNTRGRMTVLSATHGIAQATAETVKPMPKRTSSALVGRWPSAETIGSRMSMNADASSGTAVSTAASAAMLACPRRHAGADGLRIGGEFGALHLLVAHTAVGGSLLRHRRGETGDVLLVFLAQYLVEVGAVVDARANVAVRARRRRAPSVGVLFVNHDFSFPGI